MLGSISYDPLVHIELGPLSISPHGIGIAVGFIVGARLLLPRTRAMGIHDDDVYSMLTRAAVGAIVGARLAYFINHYSDFDSPLDVFRVWEGGISLLGGFFGAILLTMPAMRRRGLSFWKVMDACAPGMALGVVVGRIGDLVVGDHLGKTTDFFLGYQCPPASVDTASPCVPGTIVHQTALYDLLLTIPLLIALLRLRRKQRFDGFLIMVFGAWYGTQRIIEDFLREDTRRLGLTGSQITAIVTVAVCLAWLLVIRRTPRFGRWDEREAAAGDQPDDTSADEDEDKGDDDHDELATAPPEELAPVGDRSASEVTTTTEPAGEHEQSPLGDGRPPSPDREDEE